MVHKEKNLQAVPHNPQQEESSLERLMGITERIAALVTAGSFLLLTAACLATL